MGGCSHQKLYRGWLQGAILNLLQTSALPTLQHCSSIFIAWLPYTLDKLLSASAPGSGQQASAAKGEGGRFSRRERATCLHGVKRGASRPAAPAPAEAGGLHSAPPLTRLAIMPATLPCAPQRGACQPHPSNPSLPSFADRTMYAVHPVALSEVKALHRHAPPLGAHRIVLTLFNGVSLPPLYFQHVRRKGGGVFTGATGPHPPARRALASHPMPELSHPGE